MVWRSRLGKLIIAPAAASVAIIVNNQAPRNENPECLTSTSTRKVTALAKSGKKDDGRPQINPKESFLQYFLLGL